jgi:hypothetical protein
LGKHFALAVIAPLDWANEQLMCLLPGLRQYAWLTVTELEK